MPSDRHSGLNQKDFSKKKRHPKVQEVLISGIWNFKQSSNYNIKASIASALMNSIFSYTVENKETYHKRLTIGNYLRYLVFVAES